MKMDEPVGRAGSDAEEAATGHLCDAVYWLLGIRPTSVQSGECSERHPPTPHYA